MRSDGKYTFMICIFCRYFFAFAMIGPCKVNIVEKAELHVSTLFVCIKKIIQCEFHLYLLRWKLLVLRFQTTAISIKRNIWYDFDENFMFCSFLWSFIFPIHSHFSKFSSVQCATCFSKNHWTFFSKGLRKQRNLIYVT